MRNLLMITYWYPPAIGAAAERMHAFARHLPARGWSVHVLTCNRETIAAPDPHVDIHGIADPFGSTGPTFANYDPRRRPSRFKNWLKSWIAPDRFGPWRRAAMASALQLLRDRRMDALFASFPPAAPVEIAAELARRFRIPLVLDFRDRWIGPGGYEPRTTRDRKRHADRERAAFAAADVVVAVSKNMAQAIAAEQSISPDRIVVIPNGFDAALQPVQSIEDASNSRLGDATHDDRFFTIAHVGTVIPRNRPDLFFDSLRQLSNRDLASDFRFQFVGNLSPDYLGATGLDSLVQTTGLVPRSEALHLLRRADALLLLTGQYVGRWGYNAKLFEYIASGLPIICLEEYPGSNDRTLLERFAAERTVFAPLGNSADLESAMHKVKAITRDRNGAARPIDPAFGAFSREALTRQLADLLDRFDAGK